MLRTLERPNRPVKACLGGQIALFIAVGAALERPGIMHAAIHISPSSVTARGHRVAHVSCAVTHVAVLRRADA